jgi:hypothetical protein
LPEDAAGAKIAKLRSLHRGVGVRPEEVAAAIVGDVGGPRDTADAVEVVEIWRDAAMDAEDLFVGHRRNWEAIEDGREGVSDVRALVRDALGVESEGPVHHPALVVAAQKEEVIAVRNSVRKKAADALDVMRAAADIVAEEKVIRSR